MKRLKNILQSNYFYYYGIGVFLLVLSLNHLFFILLLITFLILNRQKYCIYIMIIILLIISILFYYKKNIKVNSTINNIYYVTNINKYYNNYLITVSNKKYKLNFYYSEPIELGQFLFIEGTFKTYDTPKIPKGFNQYKYYFGNNIYGIIEIESISKLNKTNKYYQIKNYFYQKFNNNNLIDNYILKFLGYQRLDEKLENSLKILNIQFLYSLTSINIFLFINLLKKIFINFNLKYSNKITILILILLKLIINDKLLINRLLLYYLLKQAFNYYNIKITNFSLINLVYVIILMFNINYAYNTYFIMSYLLSCSLVLLQQSYQNYHFLKKIYKLSFIYIIISIPFINQINILYFILAPIYNIVVSYIFIPLIFLNKLLPNISFIKNIITIIQTFILQYESINKYFIFNIGKLNYFIITLYYFTLFFLVKYKSKISFLLLIFIILSPKLFIKFKEPKLYILDVGQGDSFVYISNNNVIVIDAYNSVTSFLINYGINKIDYLIITHSDFDHSSEVETLYQNFHIDKIVVSKYDKYKYNYKNIKYVEANTTIKSSEVKLKFFGPLKNYYHSNNNSLVFKFSFYNQSILFTGDIHQDAEKDLISTYNSQLKANILKVAHHGSKTSSSEEFIFTVNPKYAIISVGRNNKFKFPNEEVLTSLTKYNVKIYRTDINRTIMITKNKIVLMSY